MSYHKNEEQWVDEFVIKLEALEKPSTIKEICYDYQRRDSEPANEGHNQQRILLNTIELMQTVRLFWKQKLKIQVAV